MRPGIFGSGVPREVACLAAVMLTVTFAAATVEADDGRGTRQTAPPAADAKAAWAQYRTADRRVNSSSVAATQGAAARSVPRKTDRPRSGWAGYAPATSWSGYRPGAAWRGYKPANGRAVSRMSNARVQGPSPYADGMARSYREYGTGRPVPLAKPWLPGSP